MKLAVGEVFHDIRRGRTDDHRLGRPESRQPAPRPFAAERTTVRILHRARRGIRAVSAVTYAGRRVYCPCCQRQLRKFKSSDADTNHICPACGSLERQRLLMLYITRHTAVLSQRLRMLHFAPEHCLYDRFRRARLLEYITADISDMPLVDVRLDITDMSCPDASFDVIICSHVLEHVDDDAQALRELRRVLRPGGQLFLQHPIDPSLDRTFEGPWITDPDDRAEAFGQADHVRRYGGDFIQRVRAAGLAVRHVPLVDELPTETVDRFGLRDGSSIRADDIYVCSISP
jgi:SAM-dependent methyltransferase